MAQPKYYRLDKDPYRVHQKVIKLVGKNKKVLEVGCGAGRLTAVFRKNNNSVTIVDVDEASIHQARQYADRFFVADIESADINFEDGFDVIALIDVLEHLKNPLKVLLKLKRYLSKGGYFVISVPNVANYKIRLKLLFGYFEYQKYGIMDENHLRFFTLRSFKRTLSDAGLRIKKFTVSRGVGFRLTWKLTPLFNRIDHVLSQMFPRLFARQFIVCAENKTSN